MVVPDRSDSLDNTRFFGPTRSNMPIAIRSSLVYTCWVLGDQNHTNSEDRMKPQILGVALLGVALLAGQARAGALETINFDTNPVLGNVVTITNQYPNVIFSAGGGDVVLTTCQNNPACTSPHPPYL